MVFRKPCLIFLKIQQFVNSRLRHSWHFVAGIEVGRIMSRFWSEPAQARFYFIYFMSHFRIQSLPRGTIQSAQKGRLRAYFIF
jgi:hypothetical protein